MVSYPRNLSNFVVSIAACLFPAGLAFADTPVVTPAASVAAAAVKGATPARMVRAPLDLRMPDQSKRSFSAKMSDASEPQATEDIAVVDISAQASPDLHISRAGVGSVYWVTHHRPQAWMIFAPMAADKNTRLFEDVRVQCEIRASSSQYQTGCP